MEAWLRPMLCATVDEVPESSDWAIEGKLDGWRVITHVNGQARLFGGRNGSLYSGKVPYIEEAIAAVLPKDSAVDGELIGSESGLGDVQGVMTCGSGPHVPSKAVPALTYVLFDVIRLDGQDMRSTPWEERKHALNLALGSMPLEHVTTSSWGDSSQAAHDEFVRLGLEGSVCKRKDSRYVNGRSPLWVKCKPQTTAEAKIVGFKEGTGSNAGIAGAIEFELVAIGARSRCKILSADLRAAATAHPELLIGRTIEIKHHGLGKTGSPRHPQFLRLRPDRDGLTPSETQAMAASARPTEPGERSQVRRAATATREPKRRMRNYAAMGDPKLLRVIDELAHQGDAHERCLAAGSGDPEADLAVARKVAQDRGLL